MKTIKELDAPCIVCQEAEEIDSGMCEDCLGEATEFIERGEK